MIEALMAVRIRYYLGWPIFCGAFQLGTFSSRVILAVRLASIRHFLQLCLWHTLLCPKFRPRDK